MNDDKGLVAPQPEGFGASRAERATPSDVVAVKPPKPMGRKAYGSIPHLPGSRLGPGDWSITPGQDAICMVKARKGDRIIVTEKLDGSNVAVANVGGEVIALSRSGYRASDSPYPQHHHFDAWVQMHSERLAGLLRPGERVNGEWLALAHGTRYALAHEPFVAFDMMVEGRRLLWDEISQRCAASGLVTARVLHDGGPVHIDEVLPLIAISGHGALEPVEGAVWRVEREGRVDFMAKWVRPDKIDGKYLTEITGHPAVWHWRAPDGSQHLSDTREGGSGLSPRADQTPESQHDQ